MSKVRALPDRPTLDVERQHAEQLLRELRAQNADALQRAETRGVSISRSAEDFTLADAQLIIAREYGFADWSLLVQYFGDVARRSQALEHARSREEWEGAVRSLLVRHKARQKRAGRVVAAFVPRLYGMTPQEALDATINEADAQLAVARETGQPSWNALLTAQAPSHQSTDYWERSPLQLAADAISANDLERLKSIVRDHPSLVNPTPYDREHGGTLANMAIGMAKPGHSLRQLSNEMREYLASLGVDLQAELNMRLANPFTARKLDEVQAYLDAGADPDWVAPNGYSMLEQALLLVWDGAVIDLLASRSTPRKALWIAAGLGDVDGVAAFLDDRGKPTAAAREIRAPFDCVRRYRHVPLFYADDDELFIEALSIAAFNGRANVIDYLASRGVNLDNMAWGVPIVNLAVGNGWLPSVEALIRNGASLDIKSENDSNGSARDMARWMWKASNDSPTFRRIAELCGLDIDELRREREQKAVKDPPFWPILSEAVKYAQQAALQQHAPEVTSEHLLKGLLRVGGLPLLFFVNQGKLDRDHFKAEMMPMVLSIPAPDEIIAVPLNADVEAILEDARDMARKRYSDNVGILNVLYAMTRHERGYAVELLLKYGGSIEELNRELRRAVLNEFK